MSIEIVSMQCCGVDELHGIRDYERIAALLYDICEERFGNDNKQAFLIFTDIHEMTMGKKLAAAIVRKKLGSVISPKHSVSPNSFNDLKVWVWTINQDALRKYWNTINKQEVDDDVL